MKNQSIIIKLFVLTVFFLPIVFNIQANILKNRNINIGDSCFDHKDYLTALIHYKKAFDTDKEFSQQMLSRMAMIEEASDHYVMALFYLNSMYYYFPDSRVIRKMEDLGNKYHLSGYNYTDLEYVISIYKEYYYYIIFSLSAIGIPFIIYLFMRKRKKQNLGFRPLIFFSILGIVFYLNNFDITPTMGIIQTDCQLMEGPSSGSNVIEFTELGQRVRIISKEDVWYKIAWKDKNVFIRDIYLLHVGN
jgi:hypothetical protein